MVTSVDIYTDSLSAAQTACIQYDWVLKCFCIHQYLLQDHGLTGFNQGSQSLQKIAHVRHS
jgi:hypothetical protein